MTMIERSKWERLAVYGTGIDADVAEAVLRAHHIPVLRKGSDVGIFGPGFAGPTAHGVSLMVPTDRLLEAQAALDPSGESEVEQSNPGQDEED